MDVTLFQLNVLALNDDSDSDRPGMDAQQSIALSKYKTIADLKDHICQVYGRDPDPTKSRVYSYYNGVM